ncbi:transport protein TonB [Candidatus Termititenax persephonae]|uniref:Transport protein TonB n=1 Tax=Candidatus Termititenax persephonae TaxID=2218525 RepID=A0A388TFJ1_9BACT|nr:transport protein TonB [Candidatus Termititenax persephonae]
MAVGFSAAEAEDDAGYELLGVTELSGYADPQNRPPPYPALALRNRWQGEVVLLLSINKSGGLDKVDLLKSSGHQILDETARQAAWGWRFQGLKQNIQVRFPVKFVLEAV